MIIGVIKLVDNIETVDTSFDTNDIYPISRDGNIIGALVVVDDLKNANLEKII